MRKEDEIGKDAFYRWSHYGLFLSLQKGPEKEIEIKIRKAFVELDFLFCDFSPSRYLLQVLKPPRYLPCYIPSFHILNSGRICSLRPSRIRYPRRVVGSHGSRLFRGALHPRGNRCDDPAPFWRRRRPRQKNGAPQHHAFILLKSSLGACDPVSHVKRVSLG